MDWYMFFVFLFFPLFVYLDYLFFSSFEAGRRYMHIKPDKKKHKKGK